MLFSGEIARVNSCSRCLCSCVWGGQNLKLLTVYLNHLCSLIHGWYCMHLVTRFKGVDLNADRRHRRRWHVMTGFSDYFLRKLGLQIIWWQMKLDRWVEGNKCCWAGDRWMLSRGGLQGKANDRRRCFLERNWWTKAGQSYSEMKFRNESQWDSRETWWSVEVVSGDTALNRLEAEE